LQSAAWEGLKLGSLYVGSNRHRQRVWGEAEREPRQQLVLPVRRDPCLSEFIQTVSVRSQNIIRMDGYKAVHAMQIQENAQPSETDPDGNLGDVRLVLKLKRLVGKK